MDTVLALTNTIATAATTGYPAATILPVVCVVAAVVVLFVIAYDGDHETTSDYEIDHDQRSP